jgi:hypothetical protein
LVFLQQQNTYNMRTLLIAAAFLLSSTFMYAFHSIDGSGKTKKKLGLPKRGAVSAALLNSAVSMPLKPFNGKANPGVVVGFRTSPSKKVKHLSVGVDAGIARQGGLQTMAFVKPSVSYAIKVSPTVQISPVLGAGLLMSKRANPEFTPITAPGGGIMYNPSTAWSPQFMTSFGIEPSVQVYKGSGLRAQVYMRYDFATQTNFAAISSMLPLTMMQLGLRFQGQ